jgi:imidazolonepropionase-like amidohydrolase
MIRTTLLRALAALAAGTGLFAASGMARFQPDPLTPPANGPRKADPTWQALQNATVHVKPGQVLEHATVVLRDGKIVSVQGTPAKAPAAGKKEGDGVAKASDDKEKKPEPPKDDISMAPAAPVGARSWDCTGLHIYPGFIDPYVEIDVPGPAADAPGQHWNAKVTPQRSAADVRGVDSSLAESLRKIGYTAAAVSPRGGIFRGSAALVSLAAADGDRSLARPPVYAENVYQAVALETAGGFRRGGGQGAADPGDWPGYPDSQMGAIALIRQTFSDADWQAAARASGAFAEQPNCLDFLAPTSDKPSAAPDHAGTYLFNTNDELEAFRVIKIADEFKRPMMILGCGTEFRRLDGIVNECKSHGALLPSSLTGGRRSVAGGASLPLIIPLNYPDAPKVGTIGQADSVDLRDLMTWEQAPTNPRRLEQAGLFVTLTTSKIRGDRGKFRENLRKAIAYGLTEDQALSMITTRPAELLGAADSMGTVEQGKLANLVVTDGDYFKPKTQVRDVWVDGKRHEVNAAPSNLKGEWEVTMTPAPKVPDGATLTITYSIDKDNNLTIRAHEKEGDAEPKITKSTARNVRVETSGYGASAIPTRLSFIFDHEPFGEAGTFTVAGVVEGDSIIGDGLSSKGDRFAWTAKRIAPEPAVDPEPAGERAGFAGTWKLAEINDAAVDPAGAEAADIPSMVIERDNAVVIKLHGEDIKPQSVKIDGKTLTMTLEGGPFGWEGIATAVGALEGDTISGTTTQADGTAHTWKFKRDPAREGRRGPRRPDSAGAEKPADPITGTWSGMANGQGLPQPLAFSLKLKLDGAAVTGSASSQLGTLDLVDGKFTRSGESGGKLTYTLNPPESPRVAFSIDVGKDSMHGTATGGMLNLTLNASRAATSPAAGEDDEEAPKDIPEHYGYPFGPYAMLAVPDQQTVMFTHATIWTSGPQGVIPDGWLLIQNGKIKALGDMKTPASGSAGAELIVVDLQGKHITPGIIDCHSHTGISGGVNEGGQAVTAEVRIQDVTDPDSMSWYWQLAGGETCVNSLHGSANPIGGQNCVNKVRWGSPEPDDFHFVGAMPGIKFALGENVKRSNGFQGNDRYPNTRMGVETLIRDRFTAAKEYAAAIKRGEKVRPDLELQTLAEILDGKRLVHCHSYRQDEILMLCRIARDFHFKIGTFQHILEGYKVADEVRDYSGGGSCFSDWWAYKVEVQDAIPYDGAIMHDVGVCVSFNSDSDELARRLNVEAGKAVKYGNIEPGEALKFVTINPAKQLHIDDHVGSLEVGKDADLAIWSVPPASPKQDMANAAGASSPSANATNAIGSGSGRTANAAPPPEGGPGAPARLYSVEGTPMSTMARCEQTWIDGRCYFSAERDAEMRQKNAAERARIIQKLLATGNKRPGGAGAGEGRPNGPPGGGPGGFGGRRRGPRPPNDLLTSGANAPDAADEAPVSLLQSMLQRAADRRREQFLQLWRMGIDPTYSRCGDCGESMGGMQ